MGGYEKRKKTVERPHS